VREFNPGRPTRSAPREPLAQAPNAALLIDFDNVTLGIRSDLQSQLRRLLNSEMIKGKVAVQRAYADWRRYPQYIVPLSESSIDLIFAPAFGSNKKNATDIRLAIDALELVFTRPEIGIFILLSGDSDFSSLVLKLKEYGKYVIGVGIRESSSDLLIQNCDEYFSYTELTGLKKEAYVESMRRDPWELVVEAVTQMKREDDVMRSDRLKQVMQSLDASFNEKDAGFSRFSKFVMEAAQRGLMTIEKMENGQYAIDVGENANVSPADEAEFKKRAPAPRDRAPAAKSRRKRAPRRRNGEPTERQEPRERQLTLAEAFELLKQALLVLGAVGEKSVGSGEARDKMVELLGEEGDPLFERPRYHRMLRQAHDAHVIELAKTDGEGYDLRLTPDAVAAGEGSDRSSADTPPAEPPDDQPAATSPRSRRASTRKSTRGRGRAAATDAASPTPEAEQGAPDVKAAPPEKPATQTPPPKKRNPRFRRGSRGGASTPPRAAPTDETTPKEPSGRTSASTADTKQPAHGARSVGPRIRGRERPHGSQPPVSAGPGESGSGRVEESASRPKPEDPAASGGADRERDVHRSSAPAPKSDVGDEDSLLRRMSAALQRVMKGPDTE